MSIPPTPTSVRGRRNYLAGLPDFRARLLMTAAGAGLVVPLIGAGLNAVNAAPPPG